MPDLGYWVAVLAGATTLVIEADRQYRTPVQIDTLKRYSILANVEATSFSVRGQRLLGHGFYVACYLIVYAVILGSVSLQRLLLQTSGGQSRAGSTLQDDFTTQIMQDTTYGLPIFVSAAMISLLSLPTTERIERIIRGVAHYFAGIPGGFYRAMDRLNAFLKDPRNKPRKGQLASLLTARVDLHYKDNEARKDWLQKDREDDTIRILNTIDRLRPLVTGESGSRHWPTENTTKLADLFEKATVKYRTIATKIGAISGKKDSKELLDSPEFWESLQDLAIDVRDNMKAVFALFCIVSAHSYVPKDDASPSKLIEAVRGVRQEEFLRNITIWSSFIAIIFSFAFYLGAYVFSLYITNTAETADWTVRSFGQNIQSVAGEATYTAGRMLCLIGIPAILCVGIRESLLSQRDWTRWEGSHLPPGYQYFKSSIAPLIVSAMLVIWWTVVYFVGKQVLTGNLAYVTPRTVSDTVRYNAGYELAAIPLVLLVCLFVYVVADRCEIDDPQTPPADRSRVKFGWIRTAFVFGLILAAAGIFLIVLSIPYALRPPGYQSDTGFVLRETATIIAPFIVFFLLFSFFASRAVRVARDRAPGAGAAEAARPSGAVV